MEYKDLAAISGKPGLYKIIKPTRASVIVESLDGKKNRLVVSASQKVSVLDEISIYTNTTEGSEPLKNILQTIHREFGADTDIDKDTSNSELLSFFKSVLPEYDQNRVYPSDVKKVLRWYHILLSEAPHLLRSGSQEEE